MEDKRMISTIVWHLVEDKGNPEGIGDYIITTDTGAVKSAKWWTDYDRVKKTCVNRWKTQKGVKVIAWAKMPEPCEACPIELIKARKEYERAKEKFEKAKEKYLSTKGINNGKEDS